MIQKKQIKEVVKKLEKNKKSIIQLSENGEFIKEWESATDVEKAIGICQGNISAVCNGKEENCWWFYMDV